MISLPNGCRCSEPKANPSNWSTAKASFRKNWYIYYRFYDPSHATKFPQGKLRIIKGMNEFQTLLERQEATKALIDVELNELKNIGFNPITEAHVSPVSLEAAISPECPFVDALNKAHCKGQYVGRTYSDIKSVLKYISRAATQLHMDHLPIKDIRPSNLLLLLEHCSRIKTTWTNNTHNVYIKYLFILFSLILQYRAIEFNPARDLKKKKVVRKLRTILTPEECRRIDEFTQEFDERLWLFINIFFHSGSRTTEILRVQGEHIDLKAQTIKYLVLKGQHYEWVIRTIKDVALPFWQKALQGCDHKSYVFSVGLKPGAKKIREEQISRRWRTHIKKKLGIACDFYSLKHLNTDQTSAILGLSAAAIHNGHKSTGTTRLYAVNESQRDHDVLKRMGNQFANSCDSKL